MTLPAAAGAQDGFAEARSGELGIRYWLSSGESKRSHNAQQGAQILGNPTSVLTYENLDANSLELFGRLNIGSGFLKGTAGIGRINVGSAVEQDFAFGQQLTAENESSVRSGALGYFSVDVGREWVFPARGRTTLGAFIGFSQWSEELEAFNGDVKVANSETIWSALRIGVAADLLLGPATRLVLDLAVVPYADVREEDTLRGVIIDGRGAGVQADAEVRYMLSPRTELRVGARYWYLKATDGTRKAAGNSFPLVEMSSVRSGATLSLLRTW